jgi:hypothetical protein
LQSVETPNNKLGGFIMKILLAAVLATALVAPCMAKDAGSDEDQTKADVQTPGKTEPRVPATMKAAPAEQIQTEGRARSEMAPAEKAPAIKHDADDGKK